VWGSTRRNPSTVLAAARSRARSKPCRDECHENSLVIRLRVVLAAKRGARGKAAIDLSSLVKLFFDGGASLPLSDGLAIHSDAEKILDVAVEPDALDLELSRGTRMP